MMVVAFPSLSTLVDEEPSLLFSPLITERHRAMAGDYESGLAVTSEKDRTGSEEGRGAGM